MVGWKPNSQRLQSFENPHTRGSLGNPLGWPYKTLPWRISRVFGLNNESVIIPAYQTDKDGLPSPITDIHG
jgi:hypothetical protein